MTDSLPEPGQIILLNGVPRAGKSSIVAAIQETYPEVWMNLGVDHYIAMTPPRCRPGIGLRPGGERPDLEPGVQVFSAALFESIAAHARLGLNVVADMGLHEAFSMPLCLLSEAARRLQGLPVFFVSVFCPIETVMERRNAGHAGRQYVVGSADDPIPAPVRRWHDAVYGKDWYDFEVDTSKRSSVECAEAIRRELETGRAGSAFARHATDSE